MIDSALNSVLDITVSNAEREFIMSTAWVKIIYAHRTLAMHCLILRVERKR
jgi:hypothetical protein